MLVTANHRFPPLSSGANGPGLLRVCVGVGMERAFWTCSSMPAPLRFSVEAQ